MMKIRFHFYCLFICLSASTHCAAPKPDAAAKPVPATPAPSLASLAQEGVGFGSMAALDQQNAGQSSSSLNDGNAAAAASGQATPERSQSLPHLQVLGAAAAAAAQPREEGEMQKSWGTLMSEKRTEIRNEVAKGGHSPRTNAFFKKELDAYNAIIDSLDYLKLDLETRKRMSENAGASAAKE